MSAESSARSDAEAITRSVDHMTRLVADGELRLTNATRMGGELARVVRAYLDDPEAVGTNALNEAWSNYMAAHSGNFLTANVPAGVGG
jgi:hypothetical protein